MRFTRPSARLLLVSCIGSCTFRAQQKTLLPRHFIERSTDRIVRHRDCEAAAFTHGTENKKVADGLRHANAGGNGMGVFPPGRMLFAGLESLYHWCTTGRLHSDHARAFFADKSDRFELSECLPHADDPVPPPVG